MTKYYVYIFLLGGTGDGWYDWDDGVVERVDHHQHIGCYASTLIHMVHIIITEHDCLPCSATYLETTAMKRMTTYLPR